MSNYPKAKGTDAENRAITFLSRWWPSVERRAQAGAKDRGDVAGAPYCIEVKNHKSWRAFEWLDEIKVETKNSGDEYGFILARRPHHQGFIGIIPEDTLAHFLDSIYGKEEQ